LAQPEGPFTPCETVPSMPASGSRGRKTLRSSGVFWQTGWPRVRLLAVQSEGVRELLGLGARLAAQIRGAIVRGEVDVDHLPAAGSFGLRPADALAPLGTGCRLLFPVNAEVGHVEAFIGFRLPGVVFVGRADEVDPADVATNGVVPSDVGSVRQLLGGQYPTCLQPLLDGRKLLYTSVAVAAEWCGRS